MYKAGTSEMVMPEQGSHGAFNWTKQWYPIASEVDLDPSKPHALMLLGAFLCRKLSLSLLGAACFLVEDMCSQWGTTI